MEWVVVNPMHAHGPFPSLGVQTCDSYKISDDCHVILDDILTKLSLEDRTLRTYRRTLGFAHVIQKELLPLLINVKNDFHIIDVSVRILVNLTIPVECLLPVEMMLKTDVGQHTAADLNYLLFSLKETFVDVRCTRAIVDHVKFLLDKGEVLSLEECESINNCLLLLRNVLHVPESRITSPSMQNQILWNLFAQNIDKILIQLMTSPHKSVWGVSMVQLIALMYKDQHVSVLQKLLNLWFEASLSESSEDNESNTSPPEQSSGGESSPMLTSDPTSDSSDNGSSTKNVRLHSHASSETEGITVNQHSSRIYQHSESSKSSGKGSSIKTQSSCGSCRRGSGGKTKKERSNDGEGSRSVAHMETKPSQVPSGHIPHLPRSWQQDVPTVSKKISPSSSEMSDYGYVTQVENQECISTSSNEDECMHSTRPVHQKPHTALKTRYPGSKSNVTVQDKKEWRRKKLVKRSKTNIMNMKALLHYTPTDEDISNLLKEFTVDFLLKGYGCLVHELHSQLLCNETDLHVDTSHFFWLVTYFLKFATQLELELEHISPVLSFDIVSYLTYEGVSLCEELDLASQQEDIDVTPCLRRMHLVVTAIREFIQAVETYRKLAHLSQQDRQHLLQLQLQIGSTEDLKCLFVLLLRQYNPSLQSKQYLQDLIVTNHILLLFLDDVGKLPDYKGNSNILDHIKQFATVEVMHQYGLLLEDFQNNGEFINDCIFTMMHHIGGDMEQVAALFQPSILKTFSQIWETDFELCDDWADLIEYVIHKFINTPNQKPLPLVLSPSPNERTDHCLLTQAEDIAGWTKDDINHLNWFYVQSTESQDPIGKIKKLYNDNGITNKSRKGIIHNLFTQNVIDHKQYDELVKMETMNSSTLLMENKTSEEDVPAINGSVTVVDVKEQENGDSKESVSKEANLHERISVLRDYLLKEKKGKSIVWLQKSLIEACYVKLIMGNLLTSENRTFTMEPVPHHYTLMKQSIPVVPWNIDQKNILLYQPFILLLHKLGFHLPSDSGKVFVRIPNFWTADVLFSIAQQLGPIDKSSLKFDAKLVNGNSSREQTEEKLEIYPSTSTDNRFGVQQEKHSSSIIRSTPVPNSGSSWLQLVIQSKIAPAQPLLLPVLSIAPSMPMNEEIQEPGSDHSICGESVASDLTRMYVSDEDEKIQTSCGA